MKLLSKASGVIGAGMLAIVGITGALVAANAPQAHAAASIVVNPGDSIQTAIDGATSGDTIIVKAGTYSEPLKIRQKSLTLRGEGAVIIKTQDPVINVGLKIEDTQNVRIENLTLDGEGNTAINQTGLDINSVNTITVDHVTVKNYTKDGFAVTTQQDPSFVKGGNVTFSNITAENNGWAGVAMYPTSSASQSVDLTVAFTGVTTLNGNTQSGILFGDDTGSAKTTGLNGGSVNLGVVHFVNSFDPIMDLAGVSPATIDTASTIDGRVVTAADFPNVTIALVTADSGITAPVVPGVPNTATATL